MGNIPVFGTIPICFAVPTSVGDVAFLVDLSTTEISWTALKREAEQGESIPFGWTLDAEGKTTNDPEQGLTGSMVPAGGVKGFNIGLMVEVLCSSITGAKLGTQQGSFIEEDGQPIDNGQFFLAIEPQLQSGETFNKTIYELVGSITEQDGTRLPNARRQENRQRLMREGIPIEKELFETLRAFA